MSSHLRVENLLEMAVAGEISILNLNSCNLIHFPDELFQPYFQSKLSELYAKGNRFEELPEKLKLLKNLLVLHVPNNRIQLISDNLSEIISLNKICISQNRVSSLPASLFKLIHLEVLDANRNVIKKIPPSIFKLPRLRILNISHNRILYIPPTILFCYYLETLILDSNSLSLLPPQICLLPRLKLLSLCSNQLQTLPHDISKLSKLSHLMLDNNPDLIALPGSICMLRLDILGLSGCNCIYDREEGHTEIAQYNLSLKVLCINRLCQWLDPKSTDNSHLSELFNIPSLLTSVLTIQGHCFSCLKPFYLPRAVLFTHQFKLLRIPTFRFPGYMKPIRLTLAFCSIACVNDFSNIL